MEELFANDTASGILVADPGVSGTTLSVIGGDSFPAVADGQRLRVRVDDELMAIIAHTDGAATMTVERGLENTAAAQHSVGAAVNAVLTVGSLLSLASVSGTALFSGPDQPDVEGPYVWLETDNPPGGWTLWTNDGT